MNMIILLLKFEFNLIQEAGNLPSLFVEKKTSDSVRACVRVCLLCIWYFAFNHDPCLHSQSFKLELFMIFLTYIVKMSRFLM